MSTEERFNKRMEDNFEIPEMNGTIQDLVLIMSGPLTSHKQNSDAIRGIAKVLLHTYLLEKKILEQLVAINGKEKVVKNIFVDKVLPQFITFVIMGLLYLLFQKP